MNEINDYFKEEEMINKCIKNIKTYKIKINILYILIIINIIYLIISILLNLFVEIFTISFLIILLYYIYLSVRFDNYIKNLKEFIKVLEYLED